MRRAPHWRRRKPSAATRDAVLWALRGDAVMGAHQIASEADIAWRRTCAALDDLMIHGLVEQEDGKYRRTERAAERRSA